ncbi:unnamed protein product [Bursaphelenchus okinawaensis]|uniref:Uncharacterized protein n=1 Tax=Bursaphelenchus okinawaensis TaxID=465554 RepID=A0A811L899_9BILA|nr:unnamed protein product [Bursaphelenchus okinawaensis]CAG9120973.1 unnamed protein product [Bursaphelenchus okinawaensis]
MFFTDNAQKSEIPATIIMGENFTSNGFSAQCGVVAPPPLPRCSSFELPLTEPAPYVGHNFGNSSSWW